MNVWIAHIMYALTLRTRPRFKEAWLARGFARIGPMRLFAYWVDKVERDSAIQKLALQIYDEFLQKTGQNASFIAKAKSFNSTMVDWVRDGGRIASDSVVDRRFALCKACEQWDVNGWGGTGKCLVCGCSGAKQRLATAECPLGKWGRV